MKALLIIGINLALIELIVFALFVTGGIFKEIHYDTWFACDDCQTDTYDVLLGWDAKGGPIRAPNSGDKVCGAVFGDSFTYGDEVSDTETWAHLLANQLSCNVLNYGVGGYGLDQAYLKYQKEQPQADFIILTVYEEMLRRNIAASWRFYAEQPNTLPKPYFRIEEEKLVHVAPPTELSLEAMKAHHADDEYWSIYKVSFPYSITFVRSIILQARQKFTPRSSIWANQDVKRLAVLTVDAFVQDAESRGITPVIQFMPRPENVSNRQQYSTDLADEIAKAQPQICLLNPYDSLVSSGASGAELRAPQGHYSARGNEIISSYLATELRDTCDLTFD